MCTPVVADQKVQPSKHGQSSRVSFEKFEEWVGLRKLSHGWWTLHWNRRARFPVALLLLFMLAEDSLFHIAFLFSR